MLQTKAMAPPLAPGVWHKKVNKDFLTLLEKIVRFKAWKVWRWSKCLSVGHKSDKSDNNDNNDGNNGNDNTSSALRGILGGRAAAAGES